MSFLFCGFRVFNGCRCLLTVRRFCAVFPDCAVYQVLGCVDWLAFRFSDFRVSVCWFVSWLWFAADFAGVRWLAVGRCGSLVMIFGC